MTNKIKPELNQISTTMLLTLYARAKYSQRDKHLFYDQKAIEIVSRMEYDFTAAASDTAMSSGTIARTLVFDELIQNFIVEHPDAVVVNIGCGLDTRFYRLDNGRIAWYNLDLPDAIAVRRQFFEEDGRVSMIAASAMDDDWAAQVRQRGKMLFVIEGLTMYLQAENVRQMLSIIRNHFDNAYVMMETMSPFWVKKQGVEKSVAQTGSKFQWGCNSFAELEPLAEGFEKVQDDNIIRGMTAMSPLYQIVSWMPVVKKLTQKILVFQKSGK